MLDEELRCLLARLRSDLQLCYRHVRDQALMAALRCPPDLQTIRRVDDAVFHDAGTAHAVLELSVWSLIFAQEGRHSSVNDRLTQTIDGVAVLTLRHVLDQFDQMHRALDNAIAPLVTNQMTRR